MTQMTLHQHLLPVSPVKMSILAFFNDTSFVLEHVDFLPQQWSGGVEMSTGIAS